MRNLVYWWIFFWLQIIGYSVAGVFGVFGMTFHADITHISFIIIAFHLLTSAWIGWTTSTVVRNPSFSPHLDTGWFMAEACMMLGMIGTIIGFIYTLVTTLGAMGSVDPVVLQRVINDLAKGIGTAGWTTLYGLIASLSIKLQMNNLEALYDRKER